MLLYIFVVFFCLGMYFNYLNERSKSLETKIKELTSKVEHIEKFLAEDDLK